MFSSPRKGRLWEYCVFIWLLRIDYYLGFQETDYRHR